jgi:formylglycine-generating enzyme required for sulfatase activity
VAAVVLLVLIAAIWLSGVFSGERDTDEPTPTITQESTVVDVGVSTTAVTSTNETTLTLQTTPEPVTEIAAPEPLPTLPAVTDEPTNIPTVMPTAAPTPLLQAGATRVLTLPGGLEVTQVFVPAGSFLMGSAEGNPLDGDPLTRYDEFPQHEVTLDAFWLDQTEVTNAQFAAFLNGSGGNQWEGGATWINLVGSAVSVGIEFNSGLLRPKRLFEK